MQMHRPGFRIFRQVRMEHFAVAIREVRRAAIVAKLQRQQLFE